MVSGLTLSIPRKKVSAWVAETSPQDTHAWLDTLPMADSAEAAQQLYRALYALNRLDLSARNRLELMELYRTPIGTVSKVLQSHLSHITLPLEPRRRRLAEFLRTLHGEMADGYKCAVHDMQQGRRPLLGREASIATGIERALRYLGEVLLRSYYIYLPYPPGVWREIHELYRYAEQEQKLLEPVVITRREGAGHTNIAERYKQILLLGLCNPYQLPQDECHQVNAFLYKWAEWADIEHIRELQDPVASFVVDLTADRPPMVYSTVAMDADSDSLRLLNTLALAEKVRSLIKDLEQGVSASSLELGAEFLDSACRDLLQHMLRAWGLGAQRQFSRSRQRGFVSLNVGLAAAHFFADGQRPFNPPDTESDDEPVERPTDIVAGDTEKDEDYIDLAVAGPRGQARDPATPETAIQKIYRLWRCDVRDQGAGGMLLHTNDSTGIQLRVGDLLGVTRPTASLTWWVGVVRWLKGYKSSRLEIGVELLAPGMTPAAVRVAGNGSHYSQTLLLPAVEVVPARRPQTLVVRRGLYQKGVDLDLLAGTELRRIRPLKLLERTGSFEHIVFVDVI